MHKQNLCFDYDPNKGHVLQNLWILPKFKAFALSDVTDGSRQKQTNFERPVPKYTKDRETLRGRLKCPHCGAKIACRVEIRGLFS